MDWKGNFVIVREIVNGNGSGNRECRVSDSSTMDRNLETMNIINIMKSSHNQSKQWMLFDIEFFIPEILNNWSNIYQYLLEI